jgi:hypothetical protein
MIFLRADMLIEENFYLSGRRVRVWVGTTHTRVPVDKVYPHDITIYNIIKAVLGNRKYFSIFYVGLPIKLSNQMVCCILSWTIFYVLV